MKLSNPQISVAIDILRSGKAILSKESTSDYVEAASFIFDNGLMFYPGVALEELEAEQAGRNALSEGSRK